MSGGYHETTLAFDVRREILWSVLCKSYFQKLIPASACVLELGAGYGHFINNIRCAQRIAVDEWEGIVNYLKPDVRVYVRHLTDLSVIEACSVDFVFASNVFEHLSQTEFASTLRQLREKLRSGGTVNIVQPNYRLAYRRYFDDYTHVAIYSDRSLCDFLVANRFRILECIPRFLPLTIKSRLPVSAPMVRLYLALPFRPFAGQMFIRATPE